MNVLVVGGTGPTGPAIVAGLQSAGHDVAILHTGQHEVDLGPDVEHIHADPHFAEPLEEALSGRRFDLVISMYGRLAVVADAMKGKTGYFIGVGALFYKGWVDSVLHDSEEASTITTAEYRDTPVPTSEDEPFEASPGDRFSEKAVSAERLVMQNDRDGVYGAIMLRFPRIYGPRQPVPREWCIIRRLLDGRREILVPDGGLLVESRVYAENAATHVLAAANAVHEVSGQVFNVADAEALTLRHWIHVVANSLDREVDLVSVPLESAALTFPYSKGPFTMGHKVLSTEKARRLLGVSGLVPAAQGLERTVKWYVSNPVSEGSGFLNDAFDYDAEDRLIAAARGARDSLLGAGGGAYRYQHPYRHPKSKDAVG